MVIVHHFTSSWNVADVRPIWMDLLDSEPLFLKALSIIVYYIWKYIGGNSMFRLHNTHVDDRAVKFKILVIVLLFTFVYLNALGGGANDQCYVRQFETKSLHPNHTIHGKISIDGNAALDAFPDKSGAGTQANPYIIENLLIDAGGSGSCISINNTDRYITIKNCIVQNSGSYKSGFYEDAGMAFDYAYNLNITNCTFQGNQHGLFIMRTNDSHVSNNEIRLNREHGLWFTYSYNITTLENRIFNNTRIGIVNLGSDGCPILKNVITFNQGHAGIQITGVDNVIFNNTITDNHGYGIYLNQATSTNITANVISRNGYDGLIIWGWSNIIHDNSLQNNVAGGIHAWNSAHDNIFGNIVLGGTAGIISFQSNWTRVYDNNISGCSAAGIEVISGRWNNISTNVLVDSGILLGGDNTLASCNLNAIDLLNTVNGKPVYYYSNQTGLDVADFVNAGQVILVNCSNSIVANITANHGFEGIRLLFCNSVLVQNNTAHDQNNHGIFLGYSNGCVIRENTVRNVTMYGIRLWGGSESNMVFLNTISSCLYNGFDDSTGAGNAWDNGTRGNYWGDYTARYTNATNNGITWNIPYQINGSLEMDNHPLVAPGGIYFNAAPSITHPLDFDNDVNATGNSISWIITDSYANMRAYDIYRNGSLISNGTWISDVPVVLVVDGLPVGSYYFSIIATDGLGGSVQDDVVFSVLDMDVTWFRTWGGVGDDWGYGVWGDGTFIYSCGMTPSFGAGNEDLMLVKWDSAGNQIWNRTWGTTGIDRGFGVWGIGSSIYTAGETNGNGPFEMLLVKWDAAGNQVWNRTEDGISYSVSGDGYGNVYIAGGGPGGMALVKWDSNGNQLWYRSWGTGHAESVWVDATGIAYTCGMTTDSKMVVVKWDTAGNPIWNRTWAEPTSSHGYAVYGDGTHIYICGARGVSTDLALVKYDVSGNQIWNRTWNGLDPNQQLGIWADASSIFVCGSTASRIILVKWDSTTSDLIWTHTWGGLASEQGRAVWGDGSSVYSCGHTSSYGAGLGDMVLVKWDYVMTPVAPTMEIVFPSNGSYFRGTFTFQVNVFATDFANITYQVDALAARLFTRNLPTQVDIADWNTISQGAHTITIVARDSAGSSTTLYLTFIKDTVVPIISIPFPANATAFNSTFSFRADVLDANFASITYQVDSRTPHAFTINASTLVDAGDWVAIGEGSHQITIQALDLAGNAHVAHIAFVKDTVAPSTTLSYNPPSDPDFIIPTTTFNLTSGDAGGSGVAATFYRLNDTAWTPYTAPFSPSTFGNGTLLIQYYSVDNGGNAEPVISLTVYIDTIAPNTTISASSCPPNFVNGTTTFTLAASDNLGGSGLWLTEYRINNGSWIAGSSFSIPVNGTFTINYRSMDNVYNVEAYGTRVYRVDAMAPNTTISFTSFAPDFVNSITTFILGGSDNAGGSGLYIRQYRIDGGPWIQGDEFTIAANGTHVIDYRSFDNVLNVEPYGTRVVRVDTIAPSSIISFIAAHGMNYVNYTTVFTLSSSDNAGGSGIASRLFRIGAGAWTPYAGPFTLGAYPNGTYSIYHYCVDNVGNVEVTMSFTVYLDIEGPTIVIGSPANQTYTNSTVPVEISSPDPDFAAAWYSITHSDNGTLAVTNRTWSPGAQETLADGRYWIRAWGNDTRGNVEQAALDVHFTVNTTVTYVVLLLNPANATYTNQFSLPLAYYTNATASNVSYLFDDTWSIPGSNTTLDLYSFANDSTFYDRSHCLRVVVVDTANETHYSAPTWFTVRVVHVPGAEVTIRLDGDPKGGNMYLVKMHVENTGTQPLRRLIIFASMRSETGYFTGSAVFATGNSTIAPGGTRMFTFQIHVADPDEEVYLTLRVIAEGYNATTTSLVVVPGSGFDVTIVVALFAAGGAVAAVSILGYKKKIPLRLKLRKRVAAAGKDNRDAASRKRDRLLQASTPSPPESRLPGPSAMQPTVLDDKLGAIPAAGTDDGMKKGAKIKLSSKAVSSPAPSMAGAPAKELAQYEREVKVDAALDKCLVCKRDLVGDVYICPSCKAAKYHDECVQALIANNEPCWACKKSFTTVDPVVDKAAVEAEIRGIDEILAALDDQYEQHKLSSETYKKRFDQFTKEKEALEKKLKRSAYK